MAQGSEPGNRETPTGGSMELKTFKTNGSDETTRLSNAGVTEAGNGNGGANGHHEARETDVFLSIEPPACNGEPNSSPATENESAQSSREMSALRRVERELNGFVYKKIRLWMVIVFMLLLIILVGLITPLICSAMYVDPDDTFDRSTFNTPLYFRGSFKLPNLVFRAELLNLSSSQSQALTAGIQEKLSDLFQSSPALGRYFSRAELQAFRNGSVIADYRLTFLVPEQEQDQLRNFTLRREMVFNVLRQSLYDQELGESDPMYVDPFSLNVTVTQ